MVTWSHGDIDTGIKASLVQSYTILLSTLLTIGRGQLSVCDTTYALFITSPPLMVYITIASICDSLGVKTNLYKRIRSNRHTTRALAALLPPIWLSLSCTLWLSRWAFNDSEEEGGFTFRQWFLHIIQYIGFSMFPGYMGQVTTAIFTLQLLLCLSMRSSELKAVFRASREGTSLRRKPWGLLCVVWTLAGCAWYVSIAVGPD